MSTHISGVLVRDVRFGPDNARAFYEQVISEAFFVEFSNFSKIRARNA